MFVTRLWKQSRSAGRLLAARPGWTMLVVLTLALGIGATTAIFMVANAVLFKPLPFASPEALAFVFTTNERREVTRASAPYDDIADWRAGADAFEDFAPYLHAEFTLTVGDDALRVVGARTDRRLFSVLRVTPAHGRAFIEQDQIPTAARVAILSHEFWRRQFGGRPSAVGESLFIEGERHEVIGVMPTDFRFVHNNVADPPAFYLPLARPDPRMARQGRVYTVMARVRPGRSLAQGEAQLRVVATQLEKNHPRTHAGWSVRVADVREEIGRSTRSTLLLILGAVLAILLLAYGNASLLLLARGIGRLPEFDLRLALGASPRRLVSELMTESVILAAVSGAIGVITAVWVTMTLRGALGERLPRMTELQLDWRVVVLAFAVTSGSLAVCAIAPVCLAGARHASRILRSTGEAPRTRRWYRGFIIVEVALATALLLTAAALVTRLAELRSTPLGLAVDRVLTFDMHLPAATFRDPARVEATQSAVIEALSRAPGVAAVGGINILPPSANNLSFTFSLDGNGGTEPDADARRANFRVVTPGYFVAGGVPIVRGRFFDANDRRDGRAVAIVNERFARRYFGNDDPIDRHVTLNYGMSAPVQRAIVAVVGDVLQAGPDAPVNPEVYIPYTQEPFRWMSVAMSVNGDPLSAASSVPQLVHGVEPSIAIDRLAPLTERVGASIQLTTLRTLLVTAFAFLALVLALGGTFGLTAFMTARRRPELAIRVALGASQNAIARLIIIEYAWLSTLGAILGVGGAIAAGRLSATVLGLSVTPSPLAMITVSAGAIIAALASISYPIYTAVKVDPIAALRV